MIRRTIPALTALALVGAASVVAGTPATAAPAPAERHDTTPTRFALEASGYSSRLEGGAVPASSNRSAFQVIGCTNLAGLHKQNHEAMENLGGLRLSELRTDVRTTKEGKTVSSWGRNRIAKVVLADAGGGANLVLEGVA